MDARKAVQSLSTTYITPETISALRRLGDKHTHSAHNKLNIFESIRGHDRISSMPSQPTDQDDIDELTEVIISLLNREDNTKDTEQETSPAASAPNTEAEIFLSLVQSLKKECHNPPNGQLLACEIEDELLDEYAVCKNMMKHFANLGEKRADQLANCQQRLTEAKRRGNQLRYMELENRRAEIHRRIIYDFQEKSLAPLTIAMEQTHNAALREIDDLWATHQAHLALALKHQRSRPIADVITEVESSQHKRMDQALGSLAAITTGHLPATSSLLTSANKLTRRSATRFRRLYAADIKDEFERQEVMERRFKAPEAGKFIVKAIMEMSEVTEFAETAKFGRGEDGCGDGGVEGDFGTG